MNTTNSTNNISLVLEQTNHRTNPIFCKAIPAKTPDEYLILYYTERHSLNTIIPANVFNSITKKRLNMHSIGRLIL